MRFLAAQFRFACFHPLHKKSPPRHYLLQLLQLLPMIASLRGILLEKHPNQAIVEAGGVGYDLTVPVSTFTTLPETGQEVRLRVHTHVREDALQLFGFVSQEEKNAF